MTRVERKDGSAAVFSMRKVYIYINTLVYYNKEYLMDLLQKIDIFIGEGKSNGKDFPEKKKKDDKSSAEVAQDAEDKLADMEKDADKDDSGLTPEEEAAKKKKQKELKKKAEREADYTPPYSAV